jgi:hypothetical protein
MYGASIVRARMCGCCWRSASDHSVRPLKIERKPRIRNTSMLRRNLGGIKHWQHATQTIGIVGVLAGAVARHKISSKYSGTTRMRITVLLRSCGLVKSAVLRKTPSGNSSTPAKPFVSSLHSLAYTPSLPQSSVNPITFQPLRRSVLANCSQT